MQSFEDHLQYFVPLQSIVLARHAKDVLAEFEATGKAVGFSAGELRSIADMSDAGYTGYLREPVADEMPDPPAI